MWYSVGVIPVQCLKVSRKYLSGAADTVSISDRLLFITGDISLGYLKSAFCMFFNKNLIDSYQLENPYTLVDSGKWTIDKLMEMSAVASQDVNNDGKFGLDDQLGFVVHDKNHPRGFLASTGINMFTKNDDGNWEFTLGSERDADVIESLNKLLYQAEGMYHYKGSNSNASELVNYNKITSKFVSDQILIMTAEFDDAVSQLRDMKSPYGVLPYPKYDETQKDYGSSARSTHNSFAMPLTCSDPDMAGAVYEALSSSNYSSVVPAYFETALKIKYSSDDDSARMYDIIRAGMTLDFGYIFNNSFKTQPLQLILESIAKENSFASNLASKKDGVIFSLEDFLQKIEINFAE